MGFVVDSVGLEELLLVGSQIVDRRIVLEVQDLVLQAEVTDQDRLSWVACAPTYERDQQEHR